jgi:hypothetical protein
LAKKLPVAATANLLEWGPASTAEEQFGLVLKHEIPIASLIEKAPNVSALQDDRPMNEYFILRRLRDPSFWQGAWNRLLGSG